MLLHLKFGVIMKNVLYNLGKYLYAIPFAIFGLMHLINGSQMAGMVPSYVPGGVFWVYLTGVALMAAGISIMINKFTKMSTLLLGILLLIFVLTIHLPALSNPQMMQMAMVGLLKDSMLAGAAFMFSAKSEN
jgi:putative oxidoreductase